MRTPGCSLVGGWAQTLARSDLDCILEYVIYKRKSVHRMEDRTNYPSDESFIRRTVSIKVLGSHDGALKEETDYSLRISS